MGGALGKVWKRVGNGKDVRAVVESNCPSRRCFSALLCASMVAGRILKNGRAFGRCEGKVGREVV